jgi:GrpB-like predicted nucleotidyltransferase (UPF0157 family)
MNPGEPARMPREVEVVEYDEAWPATFRVVQATVLTALGPMVSKVEHVGSTAVPGLAAKPIVDIDVLLSDSASLTDVVARLGSVGYRHLGNLGIEGREAFDQPEDLPEHHLYICLPEGREFARHLAFRDYLRSNPVVAAEYATLKRQLATKHRQDRDAYTEGKTVFIEDVLRSAASE